MSKAISFVRGMGMGLAVGCIAGGVGGLYLQSHKKGFKRNVGKALRNVSDLVDNVTGMF